VNVAGTVELCVGAVMSTFQRSGAGVFSTWVWDSIAAATGVDAPDRVTRVLGTVRLHMQTLLDGFLNRLF